jgi:transcription elongation factor Elf1
VLRKLRVNCPGCRAELSVQCGNEDLVQVQCPDCGKRFAARPPKYSPTPVDDPLANYQYQSWDAPVRNKRPSSKKRADDESIQKMVVAALILVCVGSVLIPLGFGGYYLFNRYSQESTQLSLNQEATTADAQSAVDASLSENNVQVIQPNPYDVNQSNSGNGTEQSSQVNSVAVQAPNIQMNPNGNPSDSPNNAMVSPYEGSPYPGANPSSPVQTPGPSMVQNPPNSDGAETSGEAPFGLSAHMRKYRGKDGVYIFVMDQQNAQIGNAIKELAATLSIKDRSIEVQNNHTIIGLRYSGALQDISKHFKFGRVSYVDEDARTIHVQPN